jgi:osmotically-inducible protein OsmY
MRASVEHKAQELAATAREQAARLDEKAAEVAARVRESDVAQQAGETARRVTDQGLERVGDWLVTSGAAERLGVTSKPRSRWTMLLVAVAGCAVGYLVATLTAGRKGSEVRDELAAAAGRLAERGGGSGAASGDASSAPAPDLVERIRARLAADPRTASLPRLNINVADGTVFVRGALPEGADEAAVHDVITTVAGVRDVDVQLTVTT